MHLGRMLAGALLFFSASLSANEVERWTSLTLQAIRINKTNPPIASRNLALLQTGMYDTINSIIPNYTPYLLQTKPNSNVIIDIAVAKASRDILAKIYPMQVSEWDDNLQKTLNRFSNEQLKQESMLFGAFIAQKAWESRQNDLKLKISDEFISLAGDPGVWVPTPPKFDPPLLPNWGKTKPFGLLRGDQFRQDGPPKFYSSEYAKDFQEIKDYGAKVGSKRSDAQTLIAKFWADGAGTVTPPGHWNLIAIRLIKSKKLDIVETSRLLTLLNMAMADAAISAWDMKYTFNCWRPVTAIHEADRDENEQTEMNTSWESFITTPPFPDYVSGHSTFSSAAATILELYFGTDKMSFSTDSEGAPGVIRTYSRFSEAAYEAGRSRIYGGIHYEFANRDGLRAGRKVGEYIYSNYLLKK